MRLQGDDAFDLRHFAILCDHFIRVIEVYRYRKAGIFTFTGFLALDDRAGIVEDLADLPRLFRVGWNDEFVQVIRWPVRGLKQFFPQAIVKSL